MIHFERLILPKTRHFRIHDTLNVTTYYCRFIFRRTNRREILYTHWKNLTVSSQIEGIKYVLVLFVFSDRQVYWHRPDRTGSKYLDQLQLWFRLFFASLISYIRLEEVSIGQPFKRAIDAKEDGVLWSMNESSYSNSMLSTIRRGCLPIFCSLNICWFFSLHN